MSELKLVLGPTNTGKTHYAIDRMLGHASGMIGLPLRLLAREVYDRICSIKGAHATALITGEERIWPKGARYFACTVEAMPVQVPVECLAVDEIQLAEDPDRGHIFTDRLLNARGTSETLFLGAETMRPILRELDLYSDAEPRTRFSNLAYSGPIKITKLPKRSAVIAFSSEDVYAIGELLRRQKGGAAIIMGALSPRTRNAQVDLYQSGEVDYLVATDAVGMGLNLDVDHIAFASASKFDGRRHRRLRPAEMAQIAGRAGRFRSHGTFGETGTCPPLEDDLVARIINHTFEPVERLEWRNSDLDFSNIEHLFATLSKPSGTIFLRQNPNALDEWVLRRLAVDPALTARSTGEARTRRLWDLCRLPDFRKAGHEGHFRLVQSLSEHLADPEARLGDTAMTNRMDRLSSTLGDIPTLQDRLAAIRTWTYVAHRDDWLENPVLWREKATELENQISDALHEALTARFVDRRTTALLASLKKDRTLMTEISDDGEISVEGHIVGRLKGLSFEPASTERSLEGKAVRSAAASALLPILSKRLAEISASDDDAFSLTDGSEILYKEAPVAQLTKSANWLRPDVKLLGGDEATLDLREAAGTRISTWCHNYIVAQLPSLTRLIDEDQTRDLSSQSKGLCYRLGETGAAIDLRADDPAVRLEADERDALKALGVRAGRVAAHIPDAQKPGAQKLISQLRTLFDAAPCSTAPEGAGSFPLDSTWSDAALAANGYLRLGSRAVRADLAERLAWEISKRRKEAQKAIFALPPELASIVSCPGGDFPGVVKGLGLVPAEKDPETGLPILWRYSSRQRRPAQKAAASRPQDGGKVQKGLRKTKRPPHKPKREKAVDPSSPFAALAALVSEPGKKANNKDGPDTPPSDEKK